MAECFPHVPFDSDVFHVLKDITQGLGYLEKKAPGAMENLEELLAAREKAEGLRRNGFSRRLGAAKKRELELILAHDNP